MLARTVLTALASMCVASCLCHAADDAGTSTVGVRIGVRTAKAFLGIPGVRLKLSWSAGVTIERGRTDDDGLVFFDLPRRPWDYLIQASLPGCSDGDATLTVTHDNDGEVLEMDLGPALVVAVRDDESPLDPLRGALVLLTSDDGLEAESVTDYDGHAVFGCLPEGVAFDVSAALPPYGYGRVTLDVPLEDRLTRIIVALAREPEFRRPTPEDYVVPVPSKKSNTASAAQKRTAPERR